MITIILNSGAVLCTVLIILIAAYTAHLNSIPNQRSIDSQDIDTVDAEYIQSQNAVHWAEHQTAVSTLATLYRILAVTLLVMGLTVLTQWITVG